MLDSIAIHPRQLRPHALSPTAKHRAVDKRADMGKGGVTLTPSSNDAAIKLA